MPEDSGGIVVGSLGADKPLGDLMVAYIHRQEAVDPYFCASMIRLARETTCHVASFPCGPMVDLGRNELVKQFLASPCEYLLFVDTDMTFSPSMVQRLYDKAMPDRILSGHCVSIDGKPVSKIRHPDDEGNDKWFLIGDPGDGVVQVDITGAAFLLTHRDVYEKVGANNPGPRPYFAFSERWGVSGMSEDTEFCLRANDCGIPVLVDGSVRPGHRKVGTLGGDTVPA